MVVAAVGWRTGGSGCARRGWRVVVWATRCSGVLRAVLRSVSSGGLNVHEGRGRWQCYNHCCPALVRDETGRKRKKKPYLNPLWSQVSGGEFRCTINAKQEVQRDDL